MNRRLRMWILSAAVFFLVPAILFGQLKIIGPEGPIGYSDIAALRTNIEIVYEGELPSHSIEWQVPFPYQDKTELFENGTALALSSGCTDADIPVSVRVTDWVGRKILTEHFTIKVRKSGDDSVVIPDPEPIPTPVDIKGSSVVLIVDSETAKKPLWLVKLLDEDEFWFDWMSSKTVGRYLMDPDNDQSESFIRAAASQNITSPFLLHQKGGKVLSITPLRETLTVEQLKTIIEKAGK